MTRNTLDDLYIFKNLINSYSSLLIEKTQQNKIFLINSIENIDIELLSNSDIEYLSELKNHHLNTTQEFEELLVAIDQKVTSFYNSNYLPVPLHSQFEFQKTLDNHSKYINSLFNSLGKDY